VIAVSMNAVCALVRGSWCSSLHSYRKVVKEVFVREGSFEERRYQGIQGSFKSNIGANCTSASQDMYRPRSRRTPRKCRIQG
jgi:hypothetical protein